MTTTKKNTALYTGVTSDLKLRLFQHKNKVFPNSYTARYNADRLVYYEYFHTILEAYAREKQIKSWSRKKKNKLVESINPDWEDLTMEIQEWE